MTGVFFSLAIAVYHIGREFIPSSFTLPAAAAALNCSHERFSFLLELYSWEYVPTTFIKYNYRFILFWTDFLVIILRLERDEANKILSQISFI